MGGLLIQDRDLEFGDRTEMEIVTKRQPTDDEWRDLMFAWKVCKHVRSNAIVLARDEATAGIGAGQMSRVDSVRLAIDKSRLESLAGAVLASDAFFPFSDGPEIAIGAGVTAIIQPGGSRRDPEVVDAADDGRHRDGLHEPPALPPLGAGAWPASSASPPAGRGRPSSATRVPCARATCCSSRARRRSTRTASCAASATRARRRPSCWTGSRTRWRRRERASTRSS